MGTQINSFQLCFEKKGKRWSQRHPPSAASCCMGTQLNSSPLSLISTHRNSTQSHPDRASLCCRARGRRVEMGGFRGGASRVGRGSVGTSDNELYRYSALKNAAKALLG